MRGGRLILVLIFVFATFTVSGQDNRKHRQVGFNVTETISQLIPFKASTTLSGPFTLVFRSGRDGKYFNFQLGARVNDFDDTFANMQVGILKKKNLNEKMVYYTSTNLLVSGGGFNAQNTQENGSDTGGFGLSFATGFEYFFHKNISVGTEAILAVLLGDSGGIDIIPPVGIYLLGKF